MAAETPPSEITTSFGEDEHGPVLAVAGEIDLHTAPRFAEALATGLERGPGFLVDLTEVDFMDSTGLRALLEVRQKVEAAGGEVVLRYADDGPVARLIGLAGVGRLFPRRDGLPPAA